MGLFDMVRGQLIDVIEWTDGSSDTLVHKYDMNGKEIMMGAQLTVRESQAAVFVDEGRLADVFGPGRYELTTRNLPVMTALRAWKFGFNSPFKSDVYFVSTRQFMDRKWGTANPVMMRDSEFGMIRVRAFGSFSFKAATAFSAVSCREPVRITVAPSRRNASTVARPMPRVPPVTMAILFSKSIIHTSFLFLPAAFCVRDFLINFIIAPLRPADGEQRTEKRRSAAGKPAALLRVT